ncbi:hypothetical protein BDV12DRAFT_171906 [Aspergillus spectabilis]
MHLRLELAVLVCSALLQLGVYTYRSWWMIAWHVLCFNFKRLLRHRLRELGGYSGFASTRQMKLSLLGHRPACQW